MQHGYMIIERHWPLVISATYGTPTVEEDKQYYARMTAVLKRKEKFVSISDTSMTSPLIPQAQRNYYAEWIKEHGAELKAYNMGAGLIISNPVVRAAASAVLWMSPLPMPYSVNKGFDTAFAWVKSRAEANGLKIADIQYNPQRA